MRVGIVNDLAMAREALRRVTLSVPGYQVAWLAADGAEAVAQARRDRPDLILMDLVMPVLDGVEATRRIMAECPCPIVVVTSSVSGNLGKVYEAMGLGALDAVDTPRLDSGGSLEGGAPLIQKMGMVARLQGTSTRPAPAGAPPGATPRLARPEASTNPLVVIGASTGGPNALEIILGGLPRDWPTPIVIIQHVDLSFAGGLARWLADRSGRAVSVARAGQAPRPGEVVLAASNDHLVLDADRTFKYTEHPLDACYRPSVDAFFASAAAHWPNLGIGVLLTGMGRDGADGLLKLRRAGWLTMAQDRGSSVIWGMPRAAIELGAAVRVLPLDGIAKALVDATSRSAAS